MPTFLRKDPFYEEFFWTQSSIKQKTIKPTNHDQKEDNLKTRSILGFLQRKCLIPTR
jgi:hypothetical protein